MRTLRPLLLAAILVAFFYLVTTHRRGENVFFPGRAEGVDIIEAAQPPTYDNEEQNNIEVYRRVLPSVVNVTSTALAFDFFYGAIPQQGQGSGVIIDREGHILTNYHVIADARQLEVTLADRSRHPAEIVGVDASHDLAVIRIKAPNLSPATLGDSTKLLVGQKVYAIGNPFGLHGSMSRGIISAMRSIRLASGADIEEAIQTDAAINPGNSGGPLLNYRGDVIGINTMIAARIEQSAGIGFAIPINAAKAVLDDLVRFGRVRRPSLGIRSLPVTPPLAEELDLPVDYGVLIIQVLPGSAAARAGLRGGSERAYLGNVPILLGGDIIVGINGQEIREVQDLGRVMNKFRAGDTVQLTIFRGKNRMQVQVTLDEARQQAT